MKTQKLSTAAYIQAVISILLIFCTFLPYLSPDKGEGSISLSFIGSALIQDDAEFKYKIFGYLFVIYMMAHTFNIFVQAHRSTPLLSSLLSLAGMGAMLMFHIYLDGKEAFRDAHYGIGFYFMAILQLAMLIAPAVVPSSQDHNTPGGKTEEEKEVEALKTKLAELEKSHNEQQ